MSERTRKCSGGCGRDMPVGPRGGGPRRCLECGIRAANENAADIRRRQGPGYERWRRGVAAYAGKVKAEVEAAANNRLEYERARR